MTTFPRYHDATLKSLSFNWDEGIAQLHLSVGVDGSDAIMLVASGVISIVCPRRFPWGPSDSVNEATVRLVPEGKVLSIEMQSGDLLEIICSDVNIT